MIYEGIFGPNEGESLHAKHEEKVLTEMQAGILYRPINPYLPAVDMLWVEENEKKERVYYAIQITFGESHNKRLEVYGKLYRYDDKDKFNIYVVTNPIHTQSYAEREKKKFFTPHVKPKEECPYNIYFAVISTEEFEDINNPY